MQKRQQFTAEFKREAVRLFKAGDRPTAAVARELGIPRNRLYKWAQDLEKKGAATFAGSGQPKANGDELATLKRDNARLKLDKKQRRTSRGNCREARLDQ
jgi:transposase